LCAKRGVLTSGCVFLSLFAFLFAGLAELEWVISEAIDPTVNQPDNQVREYFVWS
jgi:hypothetical protein